MLKFLCKFYISVICIYTKYINLQNRKNSTIVILDKIYAFFRDIALTKF